MPRTKPKTKAAKREVVREDMHRFKHGTLKSGSGDKVTNRKQAVAIALNQAGEGRKRKARDKRLESAKL